MWSGKSAFRDIVRGSPNESLRSVRSRIANLSGTAHRNARRAGGGNASRFSGRAKSKRQQGRSHTFNPLPADLAQFGIEIGGNYLGFAFGCGVVSTQRWRHASSNELAI